VTRVAPSHLREARPPAGGPPRGRRIGVFGGTFDPPHLGHLIAAQEVMQAMELDQLLLVPAAQPPHKGMEGLTPGPVRLRMVGEAVADDARFGICDLELVRGGVSWTVDTLRELRGTRTHGQDRLFLVLGADQWRTFGTWREPREVARLATLVVMTREGAGASGDAGFGPGTAPAHEEVSVPRIDVSSTDIRRRVREGRSIRYLVPEAVRRIIKAEKLYLREP
jgi:nicotinate-nucleotide adenylyltransferase